MFGHFEEDIENTTVYHIGDVELAYVNMISTLEDGSDYTY